jgi:hypothetical protein
MTMPRRFAPALVAALLALGAGGCFAKKPASVTVPLSFRPTSQLKMGAFAGDLPDTPVHVGTVNDARDKKDQVGENLENKTPIPVLAGNVEPTQFIHDTTRDLLRRAGLQVSDDQAAAERVLVTDLQHFWVKETNTYEAEVRATITVQDKGGRQLWKGTTNGTAERFGRSLKAENYQEVFSDATVDLVQNLLGNPGFRAALKRDARPPAGAQ